MQRREFIKATGTLLAASTLPNTAAFALDPESKGRTVLPLNRNWRYHPTKVNGAHLASFNDASFESVVIPHTNVRLPWHSFDDKDYEFVSTYRRRFRYPATAKGKRVFVDFEGAMTASTVWINGHRSWRIQRRLHAFLFRTHEASSLRRGKCSHRPA